MHVLDRQSGPSTATHPDRHLRHHGRDDPLGAVPAQAAHGPPQRVDLRPGVSSGGYSTLVGRHVGSGRTSQDGPAPPETCGGHGLSGVIDQRLSHPGAVNNISVGIEGVHFDRGTARRVGTGAFLDSPVPAVRVGAANNNEWIDPVRHSPRQS